jgi:hypothetical protein
MRMMALSTNEIGFPLSNEEVEAEATRLVKKQIAAIDALHEKFWTASRECLQVRFYQSDIVTVFSSGNTYFF